MTPNDLILNNKVKQEMNWFFPWNQIRWRWCCIGSVCRVRLILILRLGIQTRNPSIYNIIRWFAGTPGQKTHCPSVWCSKQYFFFIISYRLGALKTIFFSLWKNKLKQFLKRILQEIMKINTWNIRCLVHDSFFPASQQTNILSWRLSNL